MSNRYGVLRSAAVIVPSAACNFPFMKKAVFLDVQDPEQLLDLLNEVPIDWTTDFHFSVIFQHLRPICKRASTIHGTMFGDILEHTMVQKTITIIRNYGTTGLQDGQAEH